MLHGTRDAAIESGGIMKGLNEVDGKGIKISERLRANVYPDSEEKLKEDIMAKPEESEDGGLIVDSETPENEEWNVREDSQKEASGH